MKTTYPFRIIAFFLMLFFCLVTQAQEEGKYPSTVLIRAFEPVAGVNANLASAKLIIIKPDNEVEAKPLESSYRLIDDNSEFEKNMKKIRTELQIWQNQGFELKSTSSVSPVAGLMITTFVLQKN